MKNKGISWHFARKELARMYLHQFSIGITSAITLFAPRRYGKTEFLLRDLLPAAEEEGYRVVYASMWADRSDPMRALLLAISEAVKPQNLVERVQSIFESPVKSIELEAEMGLVGKVKSSVELSESAADTSSVMLKIPAHLDLLIQRAAPGKVLLLLDEVQYLAKPHFEDMVASIRTMLDIRKDKVHVVYTGSSRVRLQRMFDAIKAPLFRASQTTIFPELDREFVTFMLRNLEKATGTKLDVEAAYQGFQSVAKSPGLFRDAIEATILQQEQNIVAICKQIADRAASGSGYEETWIGLKDIDRAILRRVVRKNPLYTSVGCVAVAQEIGIKQLTPQQIQNSVNRLVENQTLLGIGRGRFEIEDPSYSAWIKEHLEQEFQSL